jgi:hypothetical protein
MDDVARDNFDFERELEKVSKKYNKNKKEIKKEALLVYEDYLDLLREFEIWDMVSDEDFAKFEKSL